MTAEEKLQTSGSNPQHSVSEVEKYYYLKNRHWDLNQFKDLEKFGENLHYIYIRGNLKVLSENSLFIYLFIYLFIVSYP